MGKRPCKADPEPLYSVGRAVYTYNSITREPVLWTIKSRETTYTDDKLSGARYTLERYDGQGHAVESLINVHQNDLYDSPEEVILYHFDDMRQIIESCTTEIKLATDTMSRWMQQYPMLFGKGGNQ